MYVTVHVFCFASALRERDKRKWWHGQGEALHGCKAEHRMGQGEALQGSIHLSFTTQAPLLQQKSAPLLRRNAESNLTIVPVILSAGTTRGILTLPAPVIDHPTNKAT